jgi:hypothetical protein
MSINWDSLNRFEDWASALHELLAAATDSIMSGDVAERVEAQKELNNFIIQSPNAVAGELDNIAKGAINDIFQTAVDEALASISSRTAALAMHVKTVRAVTLETEAAAKSIKLESATKAIGAATQIIRDLNSLKTVLSDSEDDQELAEKIDRAVKSIQDLVPSVMAVKNTE